MGSANYADRMPKGITRIKKILDFRIRENASLAVGEPKGRINWVLTHPAASAKSADSFLSVFANFAPLREEMGEELSDKGRKTLSFVPDVALSYRVEKTGKLYT